MDPRNLDNSTLIQRTQELVRKEREATTAILHHLREIERRMLYAERGYSSMFDYAVKELKYSEAAAHRRLAAMRLLKELPAIEEKIQRGTLTLTAIAQAHVFFKQEAKAHRKLDSDQKRDILTALEGKSTREIERELIQKSSDPVQMIPERVRAISEYHRELKITVTEQTWKTLELLKGYLAHKHPYLTYGELIGLLAKMGVERLNPAREPLRNSQVA